jgi:hypothetical protein
MGINKQNILGVFIMRKNLLSSSIGLLSLGVNVVAISLGVNLVHLDTNAAQATIANVLSGPIASDVATPNTTTVLGADATTPATTPVVGGGAAAGIIYAAEIFGSGSNATILPSDDPDTGVVAAVEYTHSGTNTIKGELLAIFTLSNGAVFAEDPTLTGNFTATGAIVGSVPAKLASGGGGKGSNFVKIKFGTGGATPSETMAKGNKLWLRYKLTGANALAVAGQKIEMKFELNDVLESYAYGIVSEEPLVVAQSANAISASIEPNNSIDAQSYRVSVESGEIAFIGGDSTEESVMLGTLKIENKATAAAPIFCPDGKNVFKFGSLSSTSCADVGTTSGTTNLTKSVFTITGGQFAASIADGGIKLGAGSVTPATDESTVTVKLSDGDLATIAAAANTGVDIYLNVNGEDKINTAVENPPLAALNISYINSTFQSFALENVEMPLIKLDGVTCTVYNVPPVEAADNASIRITNKSSISGTVVASLYDAVSGGEPLFTEVLNGGDSIAPKATLVINPATLQALNSGNSWGGRAVLKLTSTLSDIEVMLLLRAKGDDKASLTNLSAGASGGGCVK